MLVVLQTGVGIEFCGPDSRDSGGKHDCDSNECILLSSALDGNPAQGWNVYTVSPSVPAPIDSYWRPGPSVPFRLTRRGVRLQHQGAMPICGANVRPGDQCVPAGGGH